MVSKSDLAFLSHCRVGHLATADREGVPHLVPVCFAVDGATLYTPVDEKPKSGRALKRLANIRANPRAALLADRYEEDWPRLGWLRIDGTAEIQRAAAEFERAALMRTCAWGNLAPFSPRSPRST